MGTYGTRGGHMSSVEPTGLRLDEVDADGAIRETVEETMAILEESGDTRLAFFKKAGMTGGAMMSGGALLSALAPGSALGEPLNKDGRPPNSFGAGDIGILNYALTLEYLEAAFYNQATANGFATGQTAIALKRTVIDENTHVKALKGVLGGKAVKSPKFDFGTTTTNTGEFLATAYALENTGVHAYHGQVFNIKSRAYLKAAVTIATVEARHASVFGLLALNSAHAISPDGAFDRGKKAKRILNAVRETHFIQ
jgi:Ferritin-like domain